MHFSKFLLLAAMASSSVFANWVEITQTQFQQGLGDFNQFNVRYRWGGTGAEMYLGKGNLGNPNARVEANIANWVAGTGKTFAFDYNATNGGTATSMLGGTTLSTQKGQTGPNTFSNTAIGNLPGSIPFLYMSIQANDTQTVSFTNMAVGGNSINDLSFNATAANQQRFFRLATNSFTAASNGLTGTLTFGGTSNFSQERPVVNIYASVVPEPGFYGMMAAGFGGLLFALRRRKANRQS